MALKRHSTVWALLLVQSRLDHSTVDFVSITWRDLHDRLPAGSATCAHAHVEHVFTMCTAAVLKWPGSCCSSLKHCNYFIVATNKYVWEGWRKSRIMKKKLQCKTWTKEELIKESGRSDETLVERPGSQNQILTCRKIFSLLRRFKQWQYNLSNIMKR